MSMALYRRYRPQKFQDVIGQDQVTKPLMAALRSERTAHAYLFSGPRGCGKTTSARILARCLNCAQGPTDTPCGECDSCRVLGTSGSGSLDVIEMDAASHGGVDDARELVERAAFAPVRDRYKIFIVDEAHMVTNQGFNALLKLVEEPPDYIKFIFATTEPEKVIPTIRSRTHHYPFRLVPPESLEELMSGLCVEEGVEIGSGVLSLVVRAGAGSVRDSLSVLDQLIGGCEGTTVTYESAIGLLGYTDSALLDDAVDAIAAQDGATLFDVVDRVVQSGHAPRRFVEDLLQRLRDLIILSLAGDAAGDALSSLPVDQLSRMQKQAAHLGAARASRSADLVNEALSSMVGATSPRLQLELLCARLLLPNTSVQGEQSSATMPASTPASPSVPSGSAAPSAQTISKLRQQFGGSAKVETQPSAMPSEPQADVSPSLPAAPSIPAQPSVPSQPSVPAPPAAVSQPSIPAVPAPLDALASEPASSDVPKTDISKPEAPKPAPPQSADTLTIRRRWPEVLSAIKAMPGGKSTAPLLSQCVQVGSYDGSVLTLQFTNASMTRHLTEERSALIASALY
ncbi:MAG: DNA polymerase III subunit gamma and tau, partial [Actinomycetaceae bacterium]|nr:DNA polymerase III subunit gamma and tau [Actinomycetaceae bacterium]